MFCYWQFLMILIFCELDSDSLMQFTAISRMKSELINGNDVQNVGIY